MVLTTMLPTEEVSHAVDLPALRGRGQEALRVTGSVLCLGRWDGHEP